MHYGLALSSLPGGDSIRRRLNTMRYPLGMYLKSHIKILR